MGQHIVSSEFQFSPDDLAYIATHYIPLDHQQLGSVSAGASYNFGEGTRLSTDMLFGTGLRRDGATPNGGHVPAYVTVNFGISQDFTLGGVNGLTARADLINAFDETYVRGSATVPAFRRAGRRSSGRAAASLWVFPSHFDRK